MAVESLIFLQISGFLSGGAFGQMLAYWEEAGLFSYFLPFLLLFALLYGLLSRTHLFGEEQKSINGIIAFAVSLMALQFEFVSRFFSEIFPRMGVGLVVILVVIILLGLFAPHNQSWMVYTFFTIGVIILILVLVNTAGALGWSQGQWWYNNWKDIAFIVVFLAVIGIVAGSTSPSTGRENPAQSALMEILAGGSSSKGK